MAGYTLTQVLQILFQRLQASLGTISWAPLNPISLCLLSPAGIDFFKERLFLQTLLKLFCLSEALEGLLLSDVQVQPKASQLGSLGRGPEHQE